MNAIEAKVSSTKLDKQNVINGKTNNDFMRLQWVEYNYKSQEVIRPQFR